MPDDLTPLEGTRGETLAGAPTHLREADPLERGTVIGRYVVIAEIGRGGMGVVFAAYDPELDRKVALKLLHRYETGTTRTSSGHARLMREAQAMAKVSHPNVVAVHDVGEHQGRVFLAMEFIEGTTLRAWSEPPHTWREVLPVFMAAGRGLAAAHDKGLVHRDFKPDNVMVGRDARVCVMDFGLASTPRPIAGDATTPLSELDGLQPDDGDTLGLPLTRFGAVLGTPAYMGPEQWAGEDVDARTDQFAFCVALFEALYGVPPYDGGSIIELSANVAVGRLVALPRVDVPGWLRRACLRGLSTDRRERFEDMHALLATLARGQARARRRWILVGLGALVAGGLGTEGLRRLADRRAEAACRTEAATIDRVFDDSARAAIGQALLATRVGHAQGTAERVMPWLDAWAGEWSQARAQLCRDATMSDPGTIEPALLARAQWCLQERKLQLQSLVDELRHADDDIANAAISSAASLPASAPCLDRAVLARLPDPPTGDALDAVQRVRGEVARAATLMGAGKYVAGLELVEPARREAEAIGWTPLTAAARRLEGTLLKHAARYDDAEATSTAAYFEAAEANAWQVAADAAIDLVNVVGYHAARHDEGRGWSRHAALAIGFAGDPLGLREASRQGALGVVDYAAGDYAAAREEDERALALLEATLGPEHPRVAEAVRNVGIIDHATGDFAAARAAFERALTIDEAALGADHPQLARSLSNLAAVELATGNTARAEALFSRALTIEEDGRGPDHPDVAVSLNNLAAVYAEAGELERAAAMHERALTIWETALGPHHPRVARSLTNLGAIEEQLGDFEAARALHARALEILEDALGPRHPQLGPILGNLGSAELALHHPADALASLQRAVAIYDAHEGDQEGEPAARLDLARALVATQGDHAVAVASARAAREGWARAGDEAGVARADAWLSTAEP